MQRLKALQQAQCNTEHIRNICIIAHVDHGMNPTMRLLIALWCAFPLDHLAN